ncbi:MAG: hypothetical protein ACR2PI_06525 [Hyphomicrobiaceae bacterium]
MLKLSAGHYLFDCRHIGFNVTSKLWKYRIELPALLARSIGEAIGFAASEIHFARRQVKLADMAGIFPIVAPDRAEKPSPAPAIMKRGPDEANHIVHRPVVDHVDQPDTSVIKIRHIRTVARMRVRLMPGGQP